MGEMFNIDIVQEAILENVELKDGQARPVDMYIPQWNMIVEYDNAWYHRNREERDEAKRQAHTKQGYTYIRLRERPLECKWEDDIPIREIRNETDRDAALEAFVEHLNSRKLTPDRPDWRTWHIDGKARANKVAEQQIATTHYSPWQAESRRANIAQIITRQGWTWDETSHVNAHTPISVTCPQGHMTRQRPTDIQQRGLTCKTCAAMMTVNV